MPGLLPGPDWRCSAYWYAQHTGLLTGSGDLEFLACLGLRAWHLAGWHQVPCWPRIAEGPFTVWLWPEWVWDLATYQLAEDVAGGGKVTWHCG